MNIKIIDVNKKVQLNEISTGSTFLFPNNNSIPYMKTYEMKDGYVTVVNLHTGALYTGAFNETPVIPFEIPEIEVKI